MEFGDVGLVDADLKGSARRKAVLWHAHVAVIVAAKGDSFCVDWESREDLARLACHEFYCAVDCARLYWGRGGPHGRRRVGCCFCVSE